MIDFRAAAVGLLAAWSMAACGVGGDDASTPTGGVWSPPPGSPPLGSSTGGSGIGVASSGGLEGSTNDVSDPSTWPDPTSGAPPIGSDTEGLPATSEHPSETTGGGVDRPVGPGPQGERYPFPQRVSYPHGRMSAHISSDDVRAWYESWRSKYLQECNGNLRPGADPLSSSLVEAQGFAMIAAAYMGDRETVDRLQAYYESKRTNAGCGLMGWKNNCAGWEDQGSATDGDIDVASGLLVAHWQWPDGGYDDKARGVLSNLRRMILDCGGTSTLYPGCAGGRPWGGCNETDVSYYSPAFFRHFAELTGDSAWAKLADDTHRIRDAGAHPTTGLVPDWQSTSGRPGSGSRKGFYSFDAIRVPFKHGLDYLWHGNEPARAWCERITDWAYAQGVETIVDGYQLDGAVAGNHHNLAVVGSLAVCSMANTQEVVDAFVAESVTLPDDYWYSGYLGTLYLLALSGNMWTPEIIDAQD